MTIDIDCISLNFTAAPRNFTDAFTGKVVCRPEPVALTENQQARALAFLKVFNPKLFKDTGQFHFRIGRTCHLYVDSEIRDKPAPVHLKIALRPEACDDAAQFVYDFASATEMALMLTNISTTIAVPATPFRSRSV